METEFLQITLVVKLKVTLKKINYMEMLYLLTNKVGKEMLFLKMVNQYTIRNLLGSN